MANEAERKWQTFRRYKFKGVKFTESPGRIRFRQRVPYWQRRPNRAFKIVRLILGAVWLGATLLAYADEGWMPAAIVFGTGFFALGAVLLVVSLVLPPTRIVTIEPGMVTIHDGYEETQIAADEIQNVDVQHSGGREYGVFVWNGPIPVFALTQEAQQNAISLREGVVAAIEMMNRWGQDAAASSAPASVPRSRRKTFEE